MPLPPNTATLFNCWRLLSDHAALLFERRNVQKHASLCRARIRSHQISKKIHWFLNVYVNFRGDKYSVLPYKKDDFNSLLELLQKDIDQAINKAPRRSTYWLNCYMLHNIYVLKYPRFNVVPSVVALFKITFCLKYRSLKLNWTEIVNSVALT